MNREMKSTNQFYELAYHLNIFLSETRRKFINWKKHSYATIELEYDANGCIVANVAFKVR